MKELINKLKEEKSLTTSEMAELLEYSYFEMTTGEYNKGIEILGLTLEVLPSNQSALSLLAKDCIEASRVFHYSELMRKKEMDVSKFENGTTEFIKSFYAIKSGKFLTKDQINLLQEFNNKHRLVVSAPTSFGKSMLISEIIKKECYNNIAIVVPTKALISETFSIMFADKDIRDQYKIINSTNSKISETKNLVILTPERMDAFLDEHADFKFDFFSMDEIYKLDNPEDERSKVFCNVLYRLSSDVKNFYLIGPYFKQFSQNFLRKTDSKFIKYDTQIVQKKILDLSSIEDKKEYQIFGKKFKKLKSIDLNLEKIIPHTPGSSLIYVRDRRRSESIAKKIAKKNAFQIELDQNFIGYLEVTFPKDWELTQMLKKGVAFHHAAMPKFIQIELLRLMNEEKLKCITCTSTIIEGINTTAKNVFIVDSSKGTKPLSDLDLLNIQGRAGRFSSHFSGNVIRLAPTSEQNPDETSKIDFPFLDKDELPIEDTIFLRDDDLNQKNKKKKEDLNEIIKKEGIPYSLIKQNKYVHFENQIKLFKKLKSDTSLKDNLLAIEALPTNELLDTILNLCYECLFNKSDLENKNFMHWQIFKLTKYYVFFTPSMNELLKHEVFARKKSTDAKLRALFYLMNHYFEFALPKYLKAFENIFNVAYDCGSKKLNLGLVIKTLEHGTSKDHEIIFKEMGFPSLMIKKISSKFEGCSDVTEIFNRAKKLKTPTSLHPFESALFNRVFK